MSKATKTFTPASLLKCFDPPDDFTGEVGWLCGYSADASFLDAAVQRFTLETAAQRAYIGRVALLALLDPGQPQIRPHEAPGVLHAPLKDLARKPFALLHAKVALLMFRHQSEAEVWRMRLVVSTGNWTRQTLEESLDLAWAIELRDNEFTDTSVQYQQIRADIRNAWNMLRWLVELFDISAITAMPNCRSALLIDRMRDICDSVTATSNLRSRFFDNRRKGLLTQLPELARRHAGSVRRNCVYMGSGFYEGSVSQGQVPGVLRKIVNALKEPKGDEGPLLTSSASVFVIAERTGCQAVALGLSAMKTLGWTVCPPAQPAFLGSSVRTLHAKFIMSANDLSRTNNKCVSAWVYLGSGNLTPPGFVNYMSPSNGNLEAGVVFADESLTWYEDKQSPECWVQNRLPIQYDHEFGQEGIPLPIQGSEFPERPPAFEAAPVAWCRYEAQPEQARLVFSSAGSADFTVLDAQGFPCKRINELEVEWPAASPRSVQVRWLDGEELKSAFVPVVDAVGRICGASLPALDMDGAWWQLERFPLAPPPEEESEKTPPPDHKRQAKKNASPEVMRERETAVRVMMRLVENIANKQTSLSETDWPLWCESLKQTLLQAKDSAAVKAFEQWKLNPLSPLREAPFRPWFAETHGSQNSDRYEQALDFVEQAWGVSGYESVAGGTFN
jgi:hypothetical protein